MISWGNVLQAQQTDTQQTSTPQTQQQSDTQAPAQQQKTPQTPDQAQPTQSDPNGAAEFVGTIVKQGDKYVFQDAESGGTFDIDHQDEVKKFEGKKVRVHGTLDPNTKTIHVQ